ERAARLQPEIDDQRGRETERDCVDERVELFTESAARSGGARHASVERIGNAAEHDERRRRRDLASNGENDRVDAAEQVEQRQTIRHQHDGAPHSLTAMQPAIRGRRVHGAVNSATTVTPAETLSPTLTFTVEPTGTKTSTREPKRMRPMRSPCCTRSPSLPS